MTAATLSLGAAAPRQEIAFDRADFDRVRALIRQKAGIDLQDGKQNMVYARLSRRLRECGQTSFRAYLDGLTHADEAEWQQFINCLTTNLTAFFREYHHFEMLAGVLREAQGRPVRIWSSACSTGEEPYSIAMTAAETRGDLAGVTIEASDIDSGVVAAAREGVYVESDATSALGGERLRRFFLKGTGPNAGRIRVRPQLRDAVAFRTFNLLASTWDVAPCDVIFCRNVLIYFDRPTQRRVIEHLHGALRPGGRLFVGHAENLGMHRDLFETAGKTAYVRHG